MRKVVLVSVLVIVSLHSMYGQSFDYMKAFDEEIEKGVKLKKIGDSLFFTGVGLGVGASILLITKELGSDYLTYNQEVGMTHGYVWTGILGLVLIIPGVVLHFVGSKHQQEALSRAYEYIRISN